MAVISKTVLSLRLFGDNLDPPQISTALNAIPTACRRKGGIHTLPSGRRIKASSGSWRLKVADRSPGDLNGQVAEVLSKVTSDLSIWRDLVSRFQCDVFCGLFMAESNEGLELSAETMALLAERGLTLGLDIYDAPATEADRKPNA